MDKDFYTNTKLLSNVAEKQNQAKIFQYSFVVPAYNEEKNIPKLYARIVELSAKLDGRWELIFINDGSRDNTLRVLEELSAKDRNVKYINLSRNFGHQAALAAGLSMATGDAIISMDCDLQDPPEVIEEMIAKWKAGNDIVYARRLNYRQDNFLKGKLSELYYNLLSRFSDVEIPRNVGDFRLVDRKVLDVVNDIEGMTPYFRGTVAWTGYKHDYVDYHRPDREEGESAYTFSKLLQLAMAGLLNFSFLPLKVGLYLGILSMIVGSGFLTYIAINDLTGMYNFRLIHYLSVVLFIFMGMLFMFLSIIAEYIGRIYDEVRDRPLYLIKNTANFNENSNS